MKLFKRIAPALLFATSMVWFFHLNDSADKWIPIANSKDLADYMKGVVKNKYTKRDSSGEFKYYFDIKWSCCHETYTYGIKVTENFYSDSYIGNNVQFAISERNGFQDGIGVWSRYPLTTKEEYLLDAHKYIPISIAIAVISGFVYIVFFIEFMLTRVSSRQKLKKKLEEKRDW